jgi:hypothetical protein
MKRSVFIIIGIVLVVVLIAIWIYVLFFGTPTSIDEQFANFGLEDTTDTTYQEPVPESQEEPVVDVETNQRLRQLTTRPVAGFTELQTSTSSPREVLYMEAGTGHIYSIDLTTGSEERISATTIPATQAAEFSKNGQYVMIQAGFSSQKEFIVGEINRASATLSNTELTEMVTSFSSTKDNRFLYSIQTGASTVAKIFNPAELTKETVFTVPFREASIEWGDEVSDPHYVYPKTARQLESFLYQIKNGDVTRLPADGYGMSAVGNDNYVLYSKQENEAYQSYYYDINANEESIAPLVQIPEKCVMGEGESPVTICANTQYEFTSLLPDGWYTGELASADELWEISADGSAATFLIDPERESGRALNITQLFITDDKVNIYFTNQSDQTLWLYQRVMNNINQN